MAADQHDPPKPIEGPLERMLDDATDLGPARGRPVDFTVTLKDSTRPDALIEWADHHGLSVQWRKGDTWAYVEGAATDVASAFGVEIHDYRRADGSVFYASRHEPVMPAPLRKEVSELGRILSDTPLRRG